MARRRCDFIGPVVHAAAEDPSSGIGREQAVAFDEKPLQGPRFGGFRIGGRIVFKEGLARIASEPIGGSPAKLAEWVKRDVAAFGKIAQQAGMKAD